MSLGRGFASDNYAGVHPEVLQAIAAANVGHAPAYGADPWTERAVGSIKALVGGDPAVYLMLTGTAANILGMDAVMRPHHSVICPESAHIHMDECGALERVTGSKMLPCEVRDGKLTVSDIEKHMVGIDFEHHSQPRVVSISQTTEVGTVYTPDEIGEIADFVHEHGMLLQMDGARIANAAASLDLPIAVFTREAGVDILSLGGTKNGLLLGEAVVFMDPAHAADFKYVRKQGMQLLSKMRFVAAQIEALFSGDLWLRNARHANEMAARLADGLDGVPGVEIAYPVQANGVFAILPASRVEELQTAFPFYLWDDTLSMARLMTSWDTTSEDVDEFVALVRG